MDVIINILIIQQMKIGTKGRNINDFKKNCVIVD
jgi:hypothetical protein